MMQDPHFVALELLRGYPDTVHWHDANVAGWRAVHEQLGVIRPLVVSRRTGRILSPPGEFESLHAHALDGTPLPAGVRDGWRVPVHLVDVAPDDEPALCLILSGGVDHALAPRIRDESAIGILLGRAERDFEAVNHPG